MICSLVPRPFFSIFICGDGKGLVISIGYFVLQTPRFLGVVNRY